MKQKQKLVEELKTGVFSIEFTKKDGTLRKMRCTLNSKYLPEVETTSTRRQSENTVSVWSVDDNGWRSFVVENLKTIQMEN